MNSLFCISIYQILGLQQYTKSFSQNQWYLNPVWISVFIGIIMLILAVIEIVIKIKRKEPRKDKHFDFPFEIVKPENLANYLEERQMLTEAKNKYIPRVRKLMHSPIEVKASNRKILIFGRASIGKTREALRLITNELLKGSDPGAILIPAIGCIPENFSYEQLPSTLLNKAVILLYDDLPNIFPADSERKESKLTTPQDRLQKVIKCLEEKTNQFFMVATARNELLNKISSFDYKKDSFWRDFEIFEICDLDRKSEFSMIKNLIDIYGIKIRQSEIEQIQEINKGYSCESIILFLKNRSNKKIEIEEINKEFKREAFESWKRSTYEALKQQKPKIEEIYKVFRFFRFQLHTPILEPILLLLTEHLMKDTMKGMNWLKRRKAFKALKFLEDKNTISIDKKIISIPDYQLENFPDLDFDTQISILIRKLNKLNSLERNVIAYSLLSLGNSKEREGDFSNALEKFEQSLIFNRNLALAYYNRGTILLKEFDQYNESISEFDKAIELDPKYSDAFCNRGVAYLEKGEYVKGKNDLNKAIELNPKDDIAFTSRGVWHVKKREYDKAINDLNRAIELNPENDNAFSNRGNCYAEKEEYDKAINDLNRAIELNPENDNAFIARGSIYLNRTGEDDKAIKDFTKAIELNPKNDNPFSYRANAYLQREEYDKAKDDLIKAIELNPKNAESMANLGTIYILRGDAEKARFWWNESLKMSEYLPDKGKMIKQRLGELEENRNSI